MKWKKRAKQLAALREAHKGVRFGFPFPDLRDGDRPVTPTSDRITDITRTPKRSRNSFATPRGRKP